MLGDNIQTQNYDGKFKKNLLGLFTDIFGIFAIFLSAFASAQSYQSGIFCLLVILYRRFGVKNYICFV